MNDSDFVLEMLGISKTFNGTVQALKNVDLRVARAEIHGLVGENGAGKSTLMNVLGGVVMKDEGEIRRDGQSVEIFSTHDARRERISFIHQELNLVSDLRVYENIFLGEELRGRLGLLRIPEMVRKTEEVLSLLKVKVDPMAYVRDLGATVKQVVEIARAIHQQATLIIMDEPTTSLTEHEIGNLFTIMRNLKQHNVSIIFISHKLNEILTVCDRFTVLRDAKVAGEGAVGNITEEDIVRMMVGHELATQEYYFARPLGEAVLEVEALTDASTFRNVSFTLRRGEVLGFTGLIGDGRSELFESVFGFRRYSSGTIRVHGKAAALHHPRNAAVHGIGYAPKDRKENSIVPDLNITQNMTLPSLSRFMHLLFLDRKLERERALGQAERLNVRMHDISDSIQHLSGGNQQKVVLGKWLEAESDIIVLDNPTQGIDIGAKSEIYKLIMTLASERRSIIILSSEFSELLKICDRIVVMFHGEITGILDRESADEHTLMLYTTGLRRDESTRGTHAEATE